jgi:hypothetical protein
MVLISCWSVNDKSPSYVDVARELVAVWAVHVYRCYRLIKSA